MVAPDRADGFPIVRGQYKVYSFILIFQLKAAEISGDIILVDAPCSPDIEQFVIHARSKEFDDYAVVLGEVGPVPVPENRRVATIATHHKVWRSLPEEYG